ncbi:MAG TPA: S1C family serine protease [Kofleriaceae bacterium]|nr:S1C family serine protease [Kofleriaceae bacterium]
MRPPAPLSVLLLCAAACGAGSQANVPAKSRARADRALTTRQIVQRTLPSVVRISSARGSGTGFVVAADGRIATSLHVVQDQRSVRVTLADGRTFDDVRLIDHDERHDLVVLKIPARGLRPLRLSRRPLAAGEPVVAIGHPLGFENTVSDGVVSAVRSQLGNDWVQISAPISPGSSGGPVLDDRGRVIGVATGLMRGAQNLNFAMPVSYLVPLIAGAQVRPLSALPSRYARTLLASCTVGDLVAVYRVANRPRRSPRATRAAVLDLLLGFERCDQVGRLLMAGLDAAERAPDDRARSAVFEVVLADIDRALRLAIGRPTR